MLDWSPAAEEARREDAVGALPPGIVPLDEMEREMVSRALKATNDNQTRAAELLGVTRDQLRYRIKKFETTRFGADDAS
jgi:transcriptional regulator with GAF, ATPase, and Fis domain